MAKVISSNEFVLRRTASAQYRLAENVRDLSRALESLSAQTKASCKTASREIDCALRQTKKAVTRHARGQAEFVNVMEIGDIDALTRLRDKMRDH